MADDTTCPLIVGDPATGLVIAGWNQFSQFATTSFNLAQNGLQALIDFSVAPVNFNISYNLTPDLQGYVRPPVPADISVAFDTSKINDPGAPPSTLIGPVSFDEAPVNTAVAPSINIGTGPGDLTAVAPTPPANPAPVVIPTAPTVALPDTPTLLSLNLPTFAGAPLPTFDSVRPELDFDVPGQTWNFTPVDYTSTLQDELQAQIELGLQGGTGLPPDVARALFEQALSKNDVSTLQAIMAVKEDRASMGWSEPDGVLDKKIIQIRQKALETSGNLNRDIYIRISDVAIANIKEYTDKGITLETKRMDLHISMQQLILDAQKFVMQSAIEIYNARATLFNAQLEAYKTDAAVFADRIQAALAEVEVYKAEIDAQRLIGEINQQSVSIYTAQIQAVLSTVEIYKAQVEGATAQVNANRAIVEMFQAQVTAFAEQVRAYAAQWDAYKSSVDAQVAKEGIYRTAVEAYAADVNAWASINSSKIAQQNLILGEKELDLKGWLGLLDRFKTQILAQTSIVDAGVRVYGSRVDLYRGEAQVESAASEANARQTSLLIESNRATVDTALKNAQLQSDQLFRLTTIIAEIKKALAQVASQLAAASMGAVHLAATASHEAANTQACSTILQITQ